MGKKSKTGKSRKDKFYHLAKETGYRARSAFKLLQLNRKYEFLQRSRVCIDLCAAPGGWLQVAANTMPVSSLIIGVDLVPIKPIHNVTTITEDITTDKCRQSLKKELRDWKVDVVLNDGAPNVGNSWIQDAFSQAELTLSALKLATDFLRKGGWFVTKVFRSKDYHALMWVFSQLFKKVYATKPQASRNESAEIFVVCQGYVAPDKLDPKFTDSKYVFKEVPQEPKKDLMKMKGKKKAEGYADDDYTLHHVLKASTFIASEEYMDLLADAHVLQLDEEKLINHELTTPELKLCMKDIKVLGKREIRQILNWRKKMLTAMEKEDKARAEAESSVNEAVENEAQSEEEEDEEEGKLAETLAKLKEEEAREQKRNRKKVMKDKRKLRDKMSLDMVIPGDEPIIQSEQEIFNLKKIKSKTALESIEVDKMEEVSEDESEDDDIAAKYVVYDRDEKPNYEFGDEADEDSEEDAESKEWSEDEDEPMEDDDADPQDCNPLVVGLETNDSTAQHKMALWFEKDAFSGLEADDDEDLEIEAASAQYRKEGGVILDRSNEKGTKRKHEADNSEGEEDFDAAMDKAGYESSDDESGDSDDDDDDDDDDSDSDSGSDYDIHAVMKQAQLSSKGVKSVKDSKKGGFEVVPAQEPARIVTKLNPVELAIGEELIKSSKRRRQIIELSYNRYTHNDDNLPVWFTKEEHRHNQKQLPVTKAQVEEQKERLKAINARPIKKVAESKARKKKKSMRKLEKARKKAEAINESVDVTDHEKWHQIKQIYSKAGLLSKKKETVAYVVAKKGTGRKVHRPAGVSGRFKVVDPRMKKDDVRRKRDLKSKGKKGSKGGRSKGGAAGGQGRRGAKAGGRARAGGKR